jgi:hypothetical protein
MYRFVSGVNSEVLVSFHTDTSAYLFISWDRQEYVNGSLAFMQVERDSENKIVSYEKFGVKNIWIENSGSYNERFNTTDLQFNPQEKSTLISLPPVYSYPNLQAKIMFKFFPFGSAYELLRNGNLPVQNLVVPAELGGYTVKVWYEMSPLDTSNGYSTVANGFMVPGENYSVPLPPSISLMYPSSDTTGVNYNTVFSHNHTGNVYEFTFGDYKVFTAGGSAKIPIGLNYGIVLPSNFLMHWSVTLHNVISTDELVKPREAGYPTAHRIKVKTQPRSFRTGDVK